MKKFFKLVIIFSLLLVIYTSLCAFSYVQTVHSDISDNVFRLHVIANSNSKEDQNLKYIIRDALLNYMNSICRNCSSKQEAMAIVEKNKETFQQITNKTIKQQGFSYNANINIGNFEFPTKNYGDISLPSGFYDAMKVEIGSAKGENWWCVMFPPLCFVDISSGIVSEESKKFMQDNLSEEEFALISDKGNNSINFKFRLLEFFGKNGLLTAKAN